jgi:acyl carrier protein
METREMSQKIDEIREVVAEVLEVEPEEIDDTGDFENQYDADSIRAIEILSRLEKKYKVEIPQSELPHMRNLKAVCAVLARYANLSR